MALLCMFAVRGGQGRGDAREREREKRGAHPFFSKITKKNTIPPVQSVKSPPMEDKTIASSDINFC